MLSLKCSSTADLTDTEIELTAPRLLISRLDKIPLYCPEDQVLGRHPVRACWPQKWHSLVHIAHLGIVLLHGNPDFNKIHLGQVGFQQEVFALQKLIVPNLDAHRRHSSPVRRLLCKNPAGESQHACPAHHSLYALPYQLLKVLHVRVCLKVFLNFLLWHLSSSQLPTPKSVAQLINIQIIHTLQLHEICLRSKYTIFCFILLCFTIAFVRHLFGLSAL